MMKQIYTCVKRCLIFSMLCFISSIVNASDMTVFNELSYYQPSKDWELVENDTSKTIQVKSPLNDATIKFYNVGKIVSINTDIGLRPQIQPITQRTLVLRPGEELNESISKDMDNNPYPIYNLFPPDSQAGFSVPYGTGSNISLVRVDENPICSLTEKCVTWEDDYKIWVKYNNEKHLDSLLGLSVVRPFRMGGDSYVYQSIVEYNEVTGYIDIEDKIFNLSNEPHTLELVSGVRQSSATFRSKVEFLKDPTVNGYNGYRKSFSNSTPLKQVFSPIEVGGWNYFNQSEDPLINKFFNDVLTGGLFVPNDSPKNDIERPSVMYGSKREVQPNNFISVVTHYYVGKEEQLTLSVEPNKISLYPEEEQNELSFDTSFPTSQTKDTQVCLYKGIDDKNLENTNKCGSDTIKFSFAKDELPQALSDAGIVTKNYFFQTRKIQGIGPSNILNVPIDRYTFGATVLGSYHYEVQNEVQKVKELTSDQVQNLLYPYFIDGRGDVSYSWVAHDDNTCKATDTSLKPSDDNKIILPGKQGNYTGCLKMEQKESGQTAYISVPIKAVEKINNELQLFLLYDNITLDQDWQNAADSVKSQWILQESQPYIINGNNIEASYTTDPKNFYVQNIQASSAEVCYKEDNGSKLCNSVMINKTEYQDIWELNEDPYKEKIKKLRTPESALTPPVFNFQQPIPSKYNFVMRQTDAIKVAIPESQAISVINKNYIFNNNNDQYLLDIVFTPTTDVKSIDFYMFNVGQVVRDYQYKDVHAKVTLTVGEGWDDNDDNSNLHLTFYDFSDQVFNNPKQKRFLRLLRTYNKNTPTFQAPVTIQFNFYTNESPIDWERLTSSSIKMQSNIKPNIEEKLENKGVLTYYKYQNIKEIEDTAQMTEVSVNGYWLFSDVIDTISFELLPEEKFTQLYAEEKGKTSILFSSKSLNQDPPILKITGLKSYESNDKLLMTYEGDNFGYTYRGIGEGKGNTLGVDYSSDIPNKINFPAPTWIQTNYPEVFDDDWNNLSYSFIQSIPFYGENDIKQMQWSIPDPKLSEGPFKLGDWVIYNENDNDVTSMFDIVKENNQTIIKNNSINAEFYNHDYKFSRKLELEEDKEFSQDSKEKGNYVIASPGEIQFSIDYKSNDTSFIFSDQGTDIFDMNIKSTLHFQCFVENTDKKIESDQCCDTKDYFLLDEITEDKIPEKLIANDQGYKFKASVPEIPFAIKSTDQELKLYYEKLQISILVQPELKFKTIQWPLSSNIVISERKDSEWQVKIEGMQNDWVEIIGDSSCLVSVKQKNPFISYEGNTLDNAKLIYISKEQEFDFDNKESVCIDNNDFSYTDDDVYQTKWKPDEGLLFKYTYQPTQKPVRHKPYTSTLIFTLNSAL